MTASGANQRTQSYALAQLADVAASATVTVKATAGTNGVMTVAIDTQRVSFFGNLLPLGGFHTHVTSTAKPVNTVPLCVLALAPSSGDSIHLSGASQMQATSCLVHSNQALTADNGSTIVAFAAEAVTTSSGVIVPQASLGALPLPDPFKNLNVDPSSCSGTSSGTTITSNQTLAAGVHLGPINVSGTTTLTLAPGDHYFCKTVTISGNSTLTGSDVVLVFDNGAILSFGGSKSTASLDGRQSGPLAGFVMIADRSYTGSFTVQTDYISQLTGTVYVPTATLAVQGALKFGSTTPWTVVDAKALTVTGATEMLINSNYASSSVPVPTGVGNQRQNVQLTQ